MKTIPKWWTTEGPVLTNAAPESRQPTLKLKSPHEVAVDAYYDLLAHDPNQRWSGLSELDVTELQQIMTEMDDVQVTEEVAWSTARSVLELVRKMLERAVSH